MKFFSTICRILLTAHLLAVLAVGPAMAQAALTPIPVSRRSLNESDSGNPYQQNRIRDLSNENSNSTNTRGTQSMPSADKTLPGQEFSRINVHVLGEVENPGIYTVEISDRLSNVLSLAIPKRTSLRLVQLRTPGERTRVFDLYRYYYQGDLSNNPFLKENDVIFVPPHRGIVRIEGPVARPGLYELSNEKTADDILKLAGGLTSAASTVHPIKVIRFSEAGKKFVLNVNNARPNLRGFKVSKGDIIVVPDIVNNPKNFDYTVEGIPGENLFYPTSSPTVFVMGSVNEAGAYPYKSHLRVKDYIAYASPNPQARMGSVTLIRDGKRRRLNFDERTHPGDILVVKSKIGLAVIVTAVTTVLTLMLTTLLLRDQIKNQ